MEDFVELWNIQSACAVVVWFGLKLLFFAVICKLRLFFFFFLCLLLK